MTDPIEERWIAVIATAAGATLGSLMRLEEESGRAGPPVPILRAAAAEMRQAPTEIAPGELTVTSTIRAWFAIS
jgi:uncharacterized protein YggE